MTVDDNYAVTDVATTPPRVIALGESSGVRVRSQFFGHRRFVMAEGIEPNLMRQNIKANKCSKYF